MTGLHLAGVAKGCARIQALLCNLWPEHLLRAAVAFVRQTRAVCEVRGGPVIISLGPQVYAGQSQANRHGHPALTPWWEYRGGSLRWGIGEGFADRVTLGLGPGAYARHPRDRDRSGTGRGSHGACWRGFVGVRRAWEGGRHGCGGLIVTLKTLNMTLCVSSTWALCAAGT